MYMIKIDLQCVIQSTSSWKSAKEVNIIVESVGQVADYYQCDESRPACLLCKSAERTCSFLNEYPPPSRTPSQIATSAQAPTPYTPTHNVSEPPTPDLPSHPTNLSTPTQGVLNMLHLELLLHAKTALFSASCFGGSSNLHKIHYELIIDYASQTPYLMHQVLAISALHLSIIIPSQTAHYRAHATSLQSVALSMFNPADTSPSTCESRFLFAGIVGMHVLTDTLQYRPTEFSLFLDKFVSYLRIARGTSIAVGDNWAHLKASKLSSMLERGQMIPDAATAIAPETDSLQTLLSASDLSPTIKNTYQQALNQLKALFQLHNDHPTSADESAGLIVAFPIRVSSEFVELVVQRRSEALAILALFAALLHRHRDMWIIGDGGRFMIEGIGAYLGVYWEPWLEWPREFVTAY